MIRRENQRRSHFNSRPHEEVDTDALNTTDFVPTFQLTTSRRGRLRCQFAFPVSVDISTHDLTKRSTMIPVLYPLPPLTFQLTTSRRGRQTHTRLIVIFRYFNSRPHEEVDGHLISLFHNLVLISTHDLTKRSTVI